MKYDVILSILLDLFLENIIDWEFHKNLVKNWPKKYYFRPKYQIEKSYDTGFKFLRHWDDTQNLKYFSYLKKFYKTLQSKEFCNNISKLFSGKYNLSCFSITSSIVYGGSTLFPHVDDIAISHDAKLEAESMINCIFFIWNC